MLTVAHRLDTIIESDKILVLHNGEVAEYAHPYLLLNNGEGGLFAEMVAATGANSEKALKERASKAYDDID